MIDADKPKPKRLILNDFTYEKAQDLMSENPFGSLAIRDELAGLLAAFERKGQESARQFCLTSWNGYSPYTIDRIGRGTIHLEHTCLSLLGNIQPARLREYLADLHESSGATNDGMIQRFQVVVWPDIRSEYCYTDRQPDDVALQRVQEIFDRVLKFEPWEPLRFRFSPHAQRLFVEWLTELENRIRQGKDTPALTAHLSKYRGLMPSLALIFEIAERPVRKRPGFVGLVGSKVSNHSDHSDPYEVSYENAARAILWCKYLESHARRVYSVFSPLDEGVRILAEKIKSKQIGRGGSFTCRDVYINGWSLLKTPEAVKPVLTVLERRNWIRAVDRGSGPEGGRPSDKYAVNPRIWEQV